MTVTEHRLAPELLAFVEDQATQKGFASPQTYIDALIRREMARETLRAMLVEAEQAPDEGVCDAAWRDSIRRLATTGA